MFRHVFSYFVPHFSILICVQNTISLVQYAIEFQGVSEYAIKFTFGEYWGETLFVSYLGCDLVLRTAIYDAYMFAKHDFLSAAYHTISRRFRICNKIYIWRCFVLSIFLVGHISGAKISRTHIRSDNPFKNRK